MLEPPNRTPKPCKDENPPEQSTQQLCTLSESLLLFGDTGPALAAVHTIEGGDAVDEDERQGGTRRQRVLQEVECEEELGGGGAVDDQEARQT